MTLRSNSYASEDFCQIKLFPILVWKNNIVSWLVFLNDKKKKWILKVKKLFSIPSKIQKELFGN